MGATIQIKTPKFGERARHRVVSYATTTDADLRELLDDRGAKKPKKSATRGDLVKAAMASEPNVHSVELADNMPD